MIRLNDMIPRTTTSTSIDKETAELLSYRRANPIADDVMPPLVPVYKGAQVGARKIAI